MSLLQSAQLGLPRLVECTVASMRDCSLLVTAGGFEDRIMGVFEHVAGLRGSRAIVLRYLPENPKNRLQEIVKAARVSGFTVGRNDIIDFNRVELDGFAGVLRERLWHLGVSEIVIDVSAMSKMAVLLCLDVALELGLAVFVFYAEAADYGPSREQYRSAKRSNAIRQPSVQVFLGIYGVARAARLSSVAMQGQPTAAIAFMSFNELLVQALVDCVFPSRLLLVNGRPPERGWREEATAWIHDTLRKEWPERDNPVMGKGEEGVALPCRCTSTLEYLETVDLILNLYWDWSVDHRIVVAPTGSKMQTVGVFFAKALHPDIHIEYPTPKGFLPSYSRGIGRRWMLDLGVVKTRLETMRSRERALMLGVLVENPPPIVPE